MKGNLFLKLEGQTYSKNEPKFLSVSFLDTFCISSRKNGRKWCLCFNKFNLHAFDTDYAEINKKFSFTRLWENIHPCNITYQSWYITFLFGHFLEEWNLLVFLPCIEPQKEVRFIKNRLLLKVWSSSKLCQKWRPTLSVYR